MTVLMDDVIGPTELDLTAFILLHLDEQVCTVGWAIALNRIVVHGGAHSRPVTMYICAT